MTYEGLKVLVEAREAINGLAKQLDCSIEELGDPYQSAYEKLGEIIERWETVP